MVRRRDARGGDEQSKPSELAEGWTVVGSHAEESLAASPQQSGDQAIQDLLHAGEVEVDESGAIIGEVGDGAEDDVVAPMFSNIALVWLGLFGGLYLLYTLGWFVVAQAYSAVNTATAAGSGSIGGVLQQMLFWSATLAPALWFAAAMVANRNGSVQRLAIFLGIGAVVLLPFPMLIARGAA